MKIWISISLGEKLGKSRRVNSRQCPPSEVGPAAVPALIDSVSWLRGHLSLLP